MKQFNVESFLPILIEAGKAILARYENHGGITYKEDRSPLTEADRISHQILIDGLAQIHPDMPVLSEEGEQFPYQIRKDWESFFLIDPLGPPT